MGRAGEGEHIFSRRDSPSLFAGGDSRQHNSKIAHLPHGPYPERPQGASPLKFRHVERAALASSRAVVPPRDAGLVQLLVLRPRLLHKTNGMRREIDAVSRGAWGSRRCAVSQSRHRAGTLALKQSWEQNAAKSLSSLRSRQRGHCSVAGFWHRAHAISDKLSLSAMVWLFCAARERLRAGMHMDVKLILADGHLMGTEEHAVHCRRPIAVCPTTALP